MKKEHEIRDDIRKHIEDETRNDCKEEIRCEEQHTKKKDGTLSNKKVCRTKNNRKLMKFLIIGTHQQDGTDIHQPQKKL